MRHLMNALAVTLALSTAAPAFADKPAAPAKESAAPKVDHKKLLTHLNEHQKYPATKTELMAACNALMDFSAEEKKWFADKLPDGTYKSAKDVLKALDRK